MFEMFRKYLFRFFMVYVIVVVPTGLVGGCSSGKLPSKLTEQELLVLKKGYMNTSVGVEKYQYPAYSESLLSALVGTGLFKQVKYIDQFDDQPDLITRVENQIHGNAVIPLFTGLSLGLFPTWTNEEWGESFSLSVPEKPEHKVFIDYRYRGMTYLGWLSGILNLVNSDRTDGDVQSHQQFLNALGYQIASNRNQIINLNRN